MSPGYDTHTGAARDSPIMHHVDKAHDKFQTLDDREAIQAMLSARSNPDSQIPAALPPSLPGDSSAAPPLHRTLGTAASQNGGDVGLQSACVTNLPPDPSSIPAVALEEGAIHNTGTAPPAPNSIVRPAARDPTNTQVPSTTLTATSVLENSTSSATVNQGKSNSKRDFPALPKTLDAPASPTTEEQRDKMIFGHHSSAQAAQRRRNYANTNAMTDYEADLTSKDRAKQKEAVKKYLAERIRQDWTWEWPRPENSSSEASPAVEAEPVASQKIEVADPEYERWKERDEWLSNASEEEESAGMPHSVSSPDTPSTRHSPYRFENPEGVGDTVKRTQHDRKQRRKKRLAEELAWNDGLACFTARRDAWTCARRVSRASMGFSRVNTNKTIKRSSLSSEDGGSSTAIEHEEDDKWEDDTEVPVADPIIPPENAMRASITPTSYNTIYDKVVVQALTPSCPMNLKDVTRSCVQGWKRDGEWPPKSSVPDLPKKKGRKMSVASLFGMEKRDDPVKENDGDKVERKPSGSAIRKSLQKILSLGHSGNKDSAQHSNGKTKGDGASH